VTLEELASVCSLSLFRMSHLFKEQTGMTPLHYLEVHRIQKAQGLLMMTSHSISEIAYQTGFQNPL
jgi:transcriptional regulator GlxA family with amidase domain